MSQTKETNEEKDGRAVAEGAVVGGVAGAALGPIGAAVGAAAGGALAGGTRSETPNEDQARSAVTGRGPADERYADTATDADGRGSDTGLTSVGATDVNAGNALVPSDQPGVRSGDADTPPAREELSRERSDVRGDETDDETGRDIGPFLNSSDDVTTPASPTPSSSSASLSPK